MSVLVTAILLLMLLLLLLQLLENEWRKCCLKKFEEINQTSLTNLALNMTFFSVTLHLAHPVHRDQCNRSLVEELPQLSAWKICQTLHLHKTHHRLMQLQPNVLFHIRPYRYDVSVTIWNWKLFVVVLIHITTYDWNEMTEVYLWIRPNCAKCRLATCLSRNASGMLVQLND